MEHGPPGQAGPPPEARRATGLAALALWAMAVPWLARGLGLELDVPTRLEIVDHVIPGAVVLACAAFLHRSAGGTPGDLLRLAAIGAACLAGLWVTVTHAVLVLEAIDGVSPWGAALLHLSAGPPIGVLAIWMLLVEPDR